MAGWDTMMAGYMGEEAQPEVGAASVVLSPEDIQPGVFLDLDEQIYHAIPALSNSRMKDLVVSPLAYYDAYLSPNRPEPEQKDCFDFGKAVHCRILEPERFASRYVRRLEKSDHKDALDTNEELKGWLKRAELKVSGNKAELIERILDSGKLIPKIWDVELKEHAERHAGKVFLERSDADNVEIMARLVAVDPYTKHLFVGGMAEVSIIVRDPETGVLLKARLDYATGDTHDLKSFTNPRKKPILKAVADAMYYEGYYKQAVFYRHVRETARKQLIAGEIEFHGTAPTVWRETFLKTKNHTCGVLFVESVRPYHMELRELRDREAAGAETNRYWSAAEEHIRTMIDRYAHCVAKYGDRPWREPAEPLVMTDADFPQLIYV